MIENKQHGRLWIKNKRKENNEFDEIDIRCTIKFQDVTLETLRRENECMFTPLGNIADGIPDLFRQGRSMIPFS